MPNQRLVCRNSGLVPGVRFTGVCGECGKDLTNGGQRLGVTSKGVIRTHVPARSDARTKEAE